MRSTFHIFCKLRSAPVPGSDRKKRKVRSTFHIFCKLGLAPVPGSGRKKKKSAVDLPHFLQAGPSICSRFRPQKRKEKCGPLFTFSVSCAQHLFQVQTAKKKRKVRSTFHIFCKLRSAPIPFSDRKKRKVRSTFHIFCKLRSAPVPGSDRKKRKKSAVDLPHFL